MQMTHDPPTRRRFRSIQISGGRLLFNPSKLQEYLRQQHSRSDIPGQVGKISDLAVGEPLILTDHAFLEFVIQTTVKLNKANTTRMIYNYKKGNSHALKNPSHLLRTLAPVNQTTLISKLSLQSMVDQWIPKGKNQVKDVRKANFSEVDACGDVFPRCWGTLFSILQGPVVQRWVSANPGLKFNLLF